MSQLHIGYWKMQDGEDLAFYLLFLIPMQAACISSAHSLIQASV